jgi:hypothetical protein
MNQFLITTAGVAILAGCEMGKLHTGDKGRIDGDGKTGCTTAEAFTKLDHYANNDNDIDRAKELLHHLMRGRRARIKYVARKRTVMKDSNGSDPVTREPTGGR